MAVRKIHITGNTTQAKIDNATEQGFVFTKSENGYAMEMPSTTAAHKMTMGEISQNRSLFEDVAKQIWGTAMTYEFRIIPIGKATSFKLGIGVDYNTAISNV